MAMRLVFCVKSSKEGEPDQKLFPLLLASIAMAYWWIDTTRSKQSSCTQDVLVQKEAESVPLAM